MRKVDLFARKPVDGHAPMLTGEALRAYVAAGIHSDHETTTLNEGREKLECGMHLFLREGSVAKDLAATLPLITERYLPQLSLCTDDLSSRDLFEHGHLDVVVRWLVQRGVPLARALRLVTVNPAYYFNLSDRKGLRLGAKADLVLFEGPKHVRVRTTIKNGRVVYREGKLLDVQRHPTKLPSSRMKVARLSLDDLRQNAKGRSVHASLPIFYQHL